MSIVTGAQPEVERLDDAPRVDASRSDKLARGLAIAGAAVILLFAIVVLASDVPCDYGEGDTATWIWLLRHGRAIYGVAAAHGMTMVRTNYPPLQLWLVAALSPSDDAILLTGRLVSVVGFALATAMVMLSLTKATGSRRVAVLGGLLLVATFRASFWAVICRADTLALGLGTVGVTLASTRTRLWPLLSAMAFAASLLTKQNLVVFPVGTIAWALSTPGERRAGLLLATTLAALVGGALSALHLFDAIVSGSVASFRAANLARHLLTSVAPSLLAVLLALPVALGRRELPKVAEAIVGPWRGCFWVGLVWIVSLGRTGADYNYLLELLTSLAVLAPISVAFGGSRRLLAGHLAVSLVESCVWVTGLFLFVLQPHRSEAKLARELLRGVNGPILSEQTYLAITAGHAPVVIPFLAAQQAAQGLWDAGPLVSAASRGELSRVLLGFPIEAGPGGALAWHDERFPPGLLAAVSSRYELVGHIESLYVYAPARPLPRDDRP
jgi:hypothetical protein